MWHGRLLLFVRPLVSTRLRLQVAPDQPQPQERALRQSSSAKLLAFGVEIGLQSLQDGVNGHRNACPVVFLGRSLCPSMERGLDAPQSDGVSHGRFDKVGQRLTYHQNGV